MEITERPVITENIDKPTVLIAGGSGLVGRHLCNKLMARGYMVHILSTGSHKIPGFKTFYWNPGSGEIDSQATGGADYIIHLAGANIGEKRWSRKRKQEIADSRIQSARLLFNVFKENPSRLKAFITASATGYYGVVTSEKVFVENDLPAGDFLGSVCQQWEAAADDFEKSGIRTVKIRTGVVLSRGGGVVEKLKLPVKIGLGAALGSGHQFMPWIHIDDLCEIYLLALENSGMNGAYNAVAPESVTNKQFMKMMAKALHAPFWLPNIPAFVLRMALGEMSGLLLEGSRVSSAKIITHGFHFKYPVFETALRDNLI